MDSLLAPLALAAPLNAYTSPPTNYLGAALFLSYIACALYLSTTISLALWRQYTTTLGAPPTRDATVTATRAARARHVKIYAFLASLSFATLSYHMLSFLLASFAAWDGNARFEWRRLSAGRLGRWMLETALFEDFAKELVGDGASAVCTQASVLVIWFWGIWVAQKGEWIELGWVGSCVVFPCPARRCSLPHHAQSQEISQDDRPTKKLTPSSPPTPHPTPDPSPLHRPKPKPPHKPHNLPLPNPAPPLLPRHPAHASPRSKTTTPLSAQRPSLPRPPHDPPQHSPPRAPRAPLTRVLPRTRPLRARRARPAVHAAAAAPRRRRRQVHYRVWRVRGGAVGDAARGRGAARCGCGVWQREWGS